MAITVTTNTFSLSSKTKNSIFKILGTTRVKIHLYADDDGDLTLSVDWATRIGGKVQNLLWCYESIYAVMGYSGKQLTQTGVEQWVLRSLYERVEGILHKVEKIRTLIRQEEIKTILREKLENNYHELVEKTEWYHAPDLGYVVLEEDYLGRVKDLVAMTFEKGDRFRCNFILETPEGLVRYEDGYYFSTSDMGLEEPVEAFNWYLRGWDTGYDDNFCADQSTVRSELPDNFPNQKAREAYLRGYTDGSHQGGMDT